ncbi:MAG: tetratricopeptide repeat protein [Gammaproteobacteria bacterium]|nr:tetratricopeptide repeat protein [Gammaproteobacteria bacterium]
MRFIQTTLALALLVAVPFTAELGLNIAGLSAFAAEEEERRQKTRRVPSMSESTFKKLAEAQELIDLKDLAGAEQVLQGMLNRSRRYNGNEIGQIHNMLGFVYFSKEDYKGAIREYRIVVEQGEDIPEGLEVTTLYTLAQLSFVDEQYTEALRYMEIWLSKANNPGPAPHIFMGQVFYQMEDYPSSIAQIEKGIDVAQTRGTAVKENWWGLLNYLYYEEENWPKVMEILEIMVREFPKRVYWIRLAGIQGQEGMEKEQIYTMEAAYTAGFLERERDLTNLAGLLMQDEVPIRAANVMRKGIDDEIIERTDKNLRTLGQAYQLAQEVDLAIPVFEDAAKLSDDGKIYERLAQLYLEDDEYTKCTAASKNALDKGGLRKKQNVYVVQGMCEYNRDNLNVARKSFVSCRNESRRVEDESNQRVCQQWITFIDREADRRRQIAAAI